MKKILFCAAMLIAAIWTNTLQASAADVPTSKNAMDSADNRADRPGKKIRQASMKGYTLTYRLLDLSERGEMEKMMGHHSVIGMSKGPDATNHLMVYIEKTSGKTLPGDVAFLITAPDKQDFRTMTMGMYGGYGVDVNLNLKGVYTIRTKIIIEGRDAVKLDDEFTFQVK